VRLAPPASSDLANLEPEQVAAWQLHFHWKRGANKAFDQRNGRGAQKYLFRSSTGDVEVAAAESASVVLLFNFGVQKRQNVTLHKRVGQR
jgi:hypothetical protein